MLCFFFFQAEDGIRDRDVTGVQTCALPISRLAEDVATQCEALAGHCRNHLLADELYIRRAVAAILRGNLVRTERSEERRVGKECRARWWPDDDEKKNKQEEHRPTAASRSGV